MADPIDLRFSSDLLNRATNMAGLGQQAAQALLRATANIGLATAKEAARLTPRSPGAGPHVADGWVADIEQTPEGVSVRVHNKSPKATERMILANGNRAPYTLLDILEYGSSPHVILPVRGDYLVFFWPKVGRRVRARRVNHPGTRPYAMLRLSKVKADIDMKKTIDAISKTLRFILSGRKVTSP